MNRLLLLLIVFLIDVSCGSKEKVNSDSSEGDVQHKEISMPEDLSPPEPKPIGNGIMIGSATMDFVLESPDTSDGEVVCYLHGGDKINIFGDKEPYFLVGSVEDPACRGYSLKDNVRDIVVVGNSTVPRIVFRTDSISDTDSTVLHALDRFDGTFFLARYSNYMVRKEEGISDDDMSTYMGTLNKSGFRLYSNSISESDCEVGTYLVSPETNQIIYPGPECVNFKNEPIESTDGSLIVWDRYVYYQKDRKIITHAQLPASPERVLLTDNAIYVEFKNHEPVALEVVPWELN